MSATSGPVRPCPVCDDPDQACTGPAGQLDHDLPDQPSRRPPQGPGPLRPYVVNGRTVKLTDDDARRAGLLDDDGEG